MRTILAVLCLGALMTACGGSSSTGNEETIGETEGDVGPTVPRGLITNQEIAVLGENREYHIYVPENYVNAPVIMLFHGHNSDYSEILGLDGEAAPFRVWLKIAEREDIIVLVPNGRYVSENEKGWNDCRADAPTNSTADDVQFVSSLLDLTIGEYQADPKKIYATGVSNGGHFSIRLAFELSEKLAAFGSIVSSHAVNSECFDLFSPVSAIFMNGTADPILPFNGGDMAENRGAVWSTNESIDYWTVRNGTEILPEVTSLADIDTTDNSRVERHLYRNGIDGTEVVLFKILGGGHTIPSIEERLPGAAVTILGNQNGDMEMAEEMWSFFKDKAN